MKLLTRAGRLFLACLLFCCFLNVQAFTFPSSILAYVLRYGGNSGTISAVNTGTTVATLTPGSFVGISSTGPGASTASITVSQVQPSAIWAGTLKVYTSGDGNQLTPWPDANIGAASTGLNGAIPSGSYGTFTTNIPAGGIYVVCTSLSSGTPLVSIQTGAAGSVGNANPSPNSLSSLALPWQYCVFDSFGGGSTISVEFFDTNQQTLALTDGAGGHAYPAVQLVIPAGGSASVGYLVLQSKPDGTDFLTLPAGAVGFKITVVSGQVRYNTAGTVDGSAGAGNGIATGRPAPNANSVSVVNPGDVYTLGRHS